MGRLRDTNVIPLGVAVQALALLVAAFFMTPGTAPAPGTTGAGSDAGSADAIASLSELPTDLRREMLPVPRVPEREKPDEPPQPTPGDGSDDALASEGPKLASLRTENVALSGPIAIPISAPMLGVPDSLDGLSLAGGAWLGEGTKSARNRGSRRGSGPSDVGGAGGGMGGGGSGVGGGRGGGSGGGGGYCPAPGQVGNGGGRGGSGGGTPGSAGRGRPRS